MVTLRPMYILYEYTWTLRVGFRVSALIIRILFLLRDQVCSASAPPCVIRITWGPSYLEWGFGVFCTTNIRRSPHNNIGHDPGPYVKASVVYTTIAMIISNSKR